MDEAKIKQANVAALDIIMKYLNDVKKREKISDIYGLVDGTLGLIAQEYEKRSLSVGYAYQAFEAAFLKIATDDISSQNYDYEKELCALLLLNGKYYEKKNKTVSAAIYGGLSKKIFEGIKTRILKVMDYWFALNNRGDAHIGNQLTYLKEFILLWVFADFPFYPRSHVVQELKKPICEKEAEGQKNSARKWHWVFNYWMPADKGGDFR